MYVLWFLGPTLLFSLNEAVCNASNFDLFDLKKNLSEVLRGETVSSSFSHLILEAGKKHSDIRSPQ